MGKHFFGNQPAYFLRERTVPEYCSYTLIIANAKPVNSDLFLQYYLPNNQSS